MNALNKVYFFSLSKAHCQSFHQDMVDLMQEAGFDQEPDTQETLLLYRQKTEEMSTLVSLSRKLDNTKEIHKAQSKVDTHYKYIIYVLKNLELDPRDIDEETCRRVKQEILQPFPLGVTRQRFHERLGLLIAFRTHIENDWQDLFQQLELTNHFQSFAEGLDLLVSVTTARSEEKGNQERGQASRVMSELADLYNRLALYTEAWSNTISSLPSIQERQQRALRLLNQINEIISSLKHSLAVSASNRRRAKKNEIKPK